MEQRRYIILRNTNDTEINGTSEVSGLGAAPSEAGARLRVDIEALEKRDIFDLQRDPEVISVAPPMEVALIAPTSTEEVEVQEEGSTWGVVATGAIQSPFTGEGIIVAVLDTGIDTDHEAFQGVELIQRDFTGEGNSDANGHGTHVAGTILGREVNGYRIGVAPGVSRALIGKVLDSNGRGTTEQIIKAIEWAIDEGAHIISMSLGFNFPGEVAYAVNQGVPTDLATSRALETYRASIRLFDALVSYVNRRGIFSRGNLLIAAAGNESKRNLKPDYEVTVAPPAAAEGILSVGALQTAGEPNINLKVADFSNNGPILCGPGVGIYSAQAGGGFVSMSGTSMATPHVTGIAALWSEKLQRETKRFDAFELTAKLVGQASRTCLAADVNPLSIGAGLVQAPLE